MLILQHQRERTHPFNTARIVSQALKRSQLIFDRNESFASRKLPISQGAALLYPGKESKLLSEIEPEKLPEQLILIDGTWDHAKALFRDIPQLHDLPQFKLAPATPGQYRIRREPTATSLSTLEATVAALKHLEPKTEGLNDLLKAFDTMVEQQLAHPKARYNEPEPGKVETLNVPRSLLRDSDNVVVAYGEATPPNCHPRVGWDEFNRQKKLVANRPPVVWVAERLSRGELSETFFAEIIRPKEPIADKYLAHMGLKEQDFDSAISLDEFRNRWLKFIREDDLLFVPSHHTLKQLENCRLPVPSHLSLKSINHDPRGKFGCLSEYLKEVSAPEPVQRHCSRAGERLANSVSLIHYLRSRFRGS